MQTALVTLAAAVAAGYVQSVTGFGSSIILMLALPHFFDIPVAAGVSCAISTCLTALLAWRYKRSIQFRLVLLPALVYTVSSLAAIRYSRFVDTALLSALFGGFLIAVGIFFLFFSGRAALRPGPFAAVLCGFLSGVCAGLFSTGGPLIVLFFLASCEQKNNYLANTQFLFAVSNIFGLAARCLNGIYTIDLLPCTLAGLAGVVAGKQLGTRMLDRVNTSLFQKIVYAMIALYGAWLVLEYLL